MTSRRRLMPRMTISRSKLLSLVFALTAAALPAAAVAQTPLPDTHTVRPGDTLWDLAQQYFNDALLWPEIYRLNTLVVEDPHWIYPGEVLRLTATAPTPAVPADTTQVAVAVDTAHAADTTVVDSTQLAEAEQETPAEVTELAPVTDDTSDTSPLFALAPRPQRLQDAFRSYYEAPYHPLRRSEFYASGFLTEGRKLPFGELLGPTAPPQISRIGTQGSTLLFQEVSFRAPKGASYQVGDTLLLVRLDRRIGDYGDVVVPTGMVEVKDVTRKDNIGIVVRQFGAVNRGQLTLPAERFNDPGSVRAQAIADGIEGRIIASRDPQELKGPMDVVFIDRGRKDGVAPGDIFEVRRTPTRTVDRPPEAPEVMAMMQIVHVRDRTATGIYLYIHSPDIRPGTKVRQVAKLPS